MGEEDEKPPPYPPSDDDPAYFFDQLDGNISLSSSISNTSLESESDPPQHIPTQVGYRPAKVTIQRPPSAWKTIRRDNKAVQ